MRFQVPQFIDIEDKIFGPLTIKQFIYIAGGAGLCFILFRFLPLILVIPLGVIIVGFSLGLAFYKINNKPLIYIIQSAVGYFFSNKLYLWRKKEKKPEKNTQIDRQKENLVVSIPKLSEGKLHELTWSLDIKENLDSKEEK